jgi:hypothetical protein
MIASGIVPIRAIIIEPVGDGWHAVYPGDEWTAPFCTDVYSLRRLREELQFGRDKFGKIGLPIIIRSTDTEGAA